jgi:uncharacterized protein (DUF433 family)
MTMNFKPYITRDPATCGGEAVVTGTRITVRTILASLAEGMSDETILADFPTLTRDGLRAVIAFAAVEAIADEITGWAGCFVVATENKVRVKRP